MQIEQERQADSDPSPAPRPSVRGRGQALTGLLLLATVGTASLVVCRVAGVDTHTPFAQLISFTPYLMPAAVVLSVVAGVLRRWRTAVLAGVLTAVLVALLLPRVVGGDAPAPGGGVPLRVMTINMWKGNATAKVMALVRAERPDVLSLQEVTEPALTLLEGAGLSELLPYRAVRPHPGVAGSALYGRAQFTGLRTLHPGTRFDMARARYVHTGVALDVVAVHPSPPVPLGDATRDWRHELALLPPADLGDPVVTVLAGDFNATLDHSGMRRLIGSGYVDAADAVGAGLLPTWQRGWVPPVTIDHILVERGVGVRAVRVHPVGVSDHRAVVADLVVPRG